MVVCKYMSGIDEQPGFPGCPHCETYHRQTHFWAIGFVNLDIENPVSEDIHPYIFLDKIVNERKCEKSGASQETHIALSLISSKEFNASSNLDMFDEMLYVANAVYCNQEHMFGKDTEVFEQVFNAAFRYSRLEGVKYE